MGPGGEPVLLLDQNALAGSPARSSGLEALSRAEALGGAEGTYALPGGHCRVSRAPPPATIPTGRASPRYATLAERTGSPVVELNRAVAVSMAFGPEAGLAIVDALTAEHALDGYHLLPAVRGDLLIKMGRFAEARASLERAATLTRNLREQKLLRERAAAVPHPRRDA